MLTPPFLEKNDIIGIVAPAGCVEEQAILGAIDFIQGQGFRTFTGEHVYATYGPFAGTDEQRASDFQTMLDRPEVKAIIMARGGYGSARLLPMLDWTQFLHTPKWICGFSDGTVWHSFLHTMGIQSMHSDMLKDFLMVPECKENISDCLNLLEGKPIVYPKSNSPWNRSGKAEGKLVGGNLSIIQSLRGTPFDLDVEGKILFLEEVGEYKYRIDRAFLNLALSGWFEKISGLVLGGFTHIPENSPEMVPETMEILLSYVPDTVPVIADFPAGHLPRNYPVIFGKTVSIEESTLICR